MKECRKNIKIACPYKKGDLIEGRIEHHSISEGRKTIWVKLTVENVLIDGRMVLRSDESNFEMHPTILPYKDGWFRARKF